MDKVSAEIIRLIKEGKGDDALSLSAETEGSLDISKEDYTILIQNAVDNDHYDHAIKLFQNNRDLLRDDPAILTNIGLAFIQTGQFEKALTILQQSLKINPDSPYALFYLGNAYKESGNYAHAKLAYAESLQRDPHFAKAYNNLGFIHANQGHVDEALQCLRKAVEIEPDRPETYKNIGNLYESLGEIDQAEQFYLQALERKPDYYDAIAGLANLLEKQRKFSEAYELILPVIDALGANSVNVLPVFARISVAIDKCDKALEVLRSAIQNRSLPREVRTANHYSLGFLYDKSGLYDEAFEQYKLANSLKDSFYDQEAHEQEIRESISVFSPRSIPSSSNPTEFPVFILGMPRSGTSLAEQILASHPKVFGAGELSYISNLTIRLPQFLNTDLQYPRCLSLLEKNTVDAISSQLEGIYRNIVPKGSGFLRITDKLPDNFRFIGLIHILFPQAKIIHCRRNPLDTCLSCFFQDFSGYLPYTNSLKNLGIYYRKYEKIMRFWQEELQIPMLDLEYEKLVKDQEKASKKLVRYIGLEWDDACLNFHKTKRLIHTASYQQVRQPIYSSSIERWKNYAPHLKKLKDALEEW